MTTIIAILISSVVGFCFGRLSALEATEVKRLTSLLRTQEKESKEQQEALDTCSNELDAMKHKLSGLGSAIKKLSK